MPKNEKGWQFSELEIYKELAETRKMILLGKGQLAAMEDNMESLKNQIEKEEKIEKEWEKRLVEFKDQKKRNFKKTKVNK